MVWRERSGGALIPQIMTSGLTSEARDTASVPKAASPAIANWACFIVRLSSKRACGSWSTTSTSGTLAIMHLHTAHSSSIGIPSRLLRAEDRGQIDYRQLWLRLVAEPPQAEIDAALLLHQRQQLDLLRSEREGHRAGAGLGLRVLRQLAACGRGAVRLRLGRGLLVGGGNRLLGALRHGQHLYVLKHRYHPVRVVGASSLFANNGDHVCPVSRQDQPADPGDLVHTYGDRTHPCGHDESQAVALCIRSHSSPRDLLPGRNGIAGRLTDDELSAGEGVPNQQGVRHLDHLHHAGRDLRAGGDVRLGDDDRGGGGDRRTGLSVVAAPAALVQGDKHYDGRHQAGYQGKNEQPLVASRNRQPLNPGHG